MKTITSSPSQPEPFRSVDSLVHIGVHPSPHRWPSHQYPCVIARLIPKDHERIRKIEGGVEWMPTLEEMKALLLFFKMAHPDLNFADEKQLVNKPESRKFYWKKINNDRVRAKHRRRRN